MVEAKLFTSNNLEVNIIYFWQRALDERSGESSPVSSHPRGMSPWVPVFVCICGMCLCV